VKFVPWSDWTDLGNPKMVKNLVRAFTIVLALIFLKGIASGNLVPAHIIVNKYSFPDFVLGKGPTQSTRILLNGSSNAGIGFKGALGGDWLDFPTI
jgi:hypothetical protein